MTDTTCMQLSPHEVREVAVKAKCDPRTVQRWLRGDRVQFLTVDRITAALRALGHADPRAAKAG